MNMDPSYYTLQFEKLSRITETVMTLQDIPSLARAVKLAMQDYQDTWLGIVDGPDIILYDSDRLLRLPIGGQGLVAYAAVHGEPTLVNDVRQDARYVHLSGYDPTLSELVVPIHEAGDVIGVLDIHDDRVDAFTEADVQFAGSLARVLGIAIRNARLYRESKVQAERLALVADMAAELTVLQSASTLVEHTVNIIGGRLGYTYAGIALVEGDQLVVKSLYDRTRFPENIASLRMRVGQDGIAGMVAVTGEPVIVRDTALHPRYIGDSSVFRSSILVPVRSNSGILGVINVENPEVDAFTQQDVDVIQTLANQVAIALENARLYHMLEETQGQLVQSERLRAVGELAAGVAHNFNNLLTSVVGYTELLQMEPSLKIYEPYLDIIMQSAQQGARIARQLQDFTRLRTNTSLEPVDLNDAISQALRITEPRWRPAAGTASADIRVHQQFQPVPTVAGNSAELVEVFTHLIMNALDAMRGAGTLTIGTTVEDNSVKAFVSDTGEGMNEETVSRIFEPFFTTKGPSIGLGLGLSVVHGILKRLGGGITVESQPGAGSRFTVFLPVHTVDDDLSEKMQEPVARQVILVIDDDPIMQQVMARMLQEHDVDVAASGEEGIRLFNERRHGLVFTDIGMPGLSGWNVAHVVRQTDPTAVVVAITGWGPHYAQGKRQTSDVDDFLAKPFGIDELKKTLAKAITLHRART